MGLKRAPIFPPHFSQKIPLFLPSPSFWCICLPKFPRPIWNKLYFICVYVYKTKTTSFTEIQYFYWKAFFSYKKWLPQCNVSTTLPYQKTLCMPILLKEQNKKQNLVYIYLYKNYFTLAILCVNRDMTSTVPTYPYFQNK